MTIAEGPKLSISNVTGKGLDGATPLPPVTRPADVVATEPPYSLGMTSGKPN